MLLRARATSFLGGVALAGAVAYFQLRQDLLQSQQVLIDQVRLLIELSPAGAALGVRLGFSLAIGVAHTFSAMHESPGAGSATVCAAFLAGSCHRRGVMQRFPLALLL